MANRTGHLALGFSGEEEAARYLTGEGWRLLARNWRPAGAARGLELDIVAVHGDCIVFVEVKTRRLRSGEAPENARAGYGPRRAGASVPPGAARYSPLSVPVYGALTASKQKNLRRAAGRYLSAYGLWSRPCRCDLICIEHLPDGRARLEHYSNVLDFRQVVDSGNAAWQPW
ncbi:MAG: YraN family protein [Desulfovibrio sp.]|jgi:putative endonuclease|nr:YraN family protein [Desulfovibrio sp.]